MRVPTFPEYAPAWVARTVARTYVALRGVDRSDKPGRRVQIQEDRGAQFRERVVSLLERVGSPHTVRGDSWPIYGVDDTAESLFVLPDI
jgi:membrane protein implicated in regulation of membrane protease activity